jgi:hypothetical protein
MQNTAAVEAHAKSTPRRTRPSAAVPLAKTVLSKDGLVMDGGKSPQWMRHGNRALSLVLRNAQYRTLDGQTHMLKPKAHAPALVEFFRVE